MRDFSWVREEQTSLNEGISQCSTAPVSSSLSSCVPDALQSSPFTSHQLSFPAVSLFPELLWLTLLTRPADSPCRALP